MNFGYSTSTGIMAWYVVISGFIVCLFLVLIYCEVIVIYTLSGSF